MARGFGLIEKDGSRNIEGAFSDQGRCAAQCNSVVFHGNQ